MVNMFPRNRAYLHEIDQSTNKFFTNVTTVDREHHSFRQESSLVFLPPASTPTHNILHNDKRTVTNQSAFHRPQNLLLRRFFIAFVSPHAPTFLEDRKCNLFLQTTFLTRHIPRVCDDTKISYHPLSSRNFPFFFFLKLS